MAECHLLCDIPFDLVRAAAAAGERGQPGHLDHLDFAELPADLRAATQPDLLGICYRLRSNLDERVRVDFAAWWQKRTTDAKAAFLAASNGASARVLDAQPAYAEAAALRGDMMAARWHCWMLLDREPGAAPELLRQAQHAELRKLLESYDEVRTAVPEFFGGFQQALAGHDYDHAARLLERIPGRLLGDGWVQHRHFELADARDDKETAIRALCATASAWTNDAAPYYNAIRALISIGEWEGAQRILAMVPPSFWNLKRSVGIAEKLAAQDAEFAVPQVLPFRGQPDLGGEIEVPSTS